MKKIQITCLLSAVLLVMFSCAFTDGAGGWYDPVQMAPAAGDWYYEEFNAGNFDLIVDNPLRLVEYYPLSTFSIDVDTAGYSITRRYIEGNRLLPKSAMKNLTASRDVSSLIRKFIILAGVHTH